MPFLRGSSPDLPGQVITFYSYKGGTGRTMALANVAYLLARNEQARPEHGVLMIDWDLEAPGLHRYFRDLLVIQAGEGEDKAAALANHPGLLDIFLELDERIPQTDDPYQGQTEKEARATIDQIDFDRFLLKTDEPSLYLLKAGRFDEEYSSRVNTFDWENLYIRSPRLLRVLAEKLAERFQYVLIDSRTGISDMSNICTMLMPEKLVVVFTPNRQSLTGIKHLVEQAVEYREQSDDPRPLIAFPLASRIDVSMPRLDYSWRYGVEEQGIEGYQPLFEALFAQSYGLEDCDLEPYFDEVKIQHVADYAYGEEIAALIEKSDDRLSLTRSYENFIERLLKLAGPWKRDISTHHPKEFDVYFSYNSSDWPEIERTVQQLKELGIRVWLDKEQIAPGERWEESIQKAINEVKTAVLFIGPEGAEGWQEQELENFLSSKDHVIPVLLPGATSLPTFLKGVRYVDFNDETALEELIWGITSVKPKKRKRNR